MSDRTQIDSELTRGDPRLPSALRRSLLIGAFAVLIVVTLVYGVQALKLLSARTTYLSGPLSPVPETLNRLSENLAALSLDDHPETQPEKSTRPSTAKRLQPLLEQFRSARADWLRLGESGFAIDVLLSRQFNRKLAELDEQLARIAGPLANSPEPRSSDYESMQRSALEVGELADEMHRRHHDTANALHTATMREIHDATLLFVILAAVALFGFTALAAAYLWQMRSYDRYLQAMNELAALLSTKSGVPLFEGLVDFLGNKLGYSYVFIAQLNTNDPQQVDTLAVHAHGKLAGNISYRLPGTPCENVLRSGVCFYPSGVQQSFPGDRLLQEMGVDSYAGTPLVDTQEQVIGILVLLDARSIDPVDVSSSLIQIIASRAQSEIERMQVEAERASALDGLEARVDARTADLRRINAQLEEEVHARRDMERQLEHARNVAEHANRTKGEFLANASHEIRTHINGLLGMLSLLEDGEIKGEQLEYVGMAHASGDVLLALINDLLDYSKIEAGQLQIESVDFDLDRLVSEIGDLFGVRARSAGLNFESEVDIGLPRQVCGDVVRIRQVLSNLVDNALKFTSDGHIALRVTANGNTHEDGSLPVRFEVEDSGIGFDPDKREQLFAPFAQADGSITRRYGGTGLGLAICSELVRMLGGEIDVDGAPGLGTRFWFTIPLRAARGLGKAKAASTRDSLEGLRVLVVDDSAVSRAYLRSLLAAWHVDCDAVNSGQEALERLETAMAEESRPFELVILDRLMPEMDGIELAERIGDDPRFGKPKLVMVTRYGGSVAADEALRSGIAGYLNKPVSQSQLFDTLIQVTGLQFRAHRPRTAVTRPKSGRILIVEDNLVNQKVAAGMLRKLGYQADAVGDGEQALAAIGRTDYDLVLMDCQMPVMDGYTAAGEIRARETEGKRLPIVAMTAHALGGEREKCLAAGMDDYLAKPVRIIDLKQTIDYWCHTEADVPVDEGAPVEQVAAQAAEAEAPEPASPAADAVDPAVLDELREVMGEEIRELIDAYLDDTARRLDELDQAIDRDPEVLVQVAHTLKGSSANVGARRFSERCSEMHQRARQDAADPSLRDLFGNLGSEFAQVRSALETYRASL
jgi:signal transduction histidine kinase/DNA-binding response OmpR family regulator/HPt (histidine-containing phosphotransfer) domain-containing protein